MTQAYNQSESKVLLHLYVKPPKEFKISQDKLLKIEKQLYSFPEPGVHWFRTPQRHHLNTLKMKSTDDDHCLFYTPNLFNKSKQGAVICLQIDDMLILCNMKFRAIEHNESNTF